MHRIFSKEPEFYVFYNGVEDYSDTITLKLSDAFMTKPDYTPLELEVKVFNINKSKGSEVLRHCKPLDEYSLFIEEVRIQTELDPENGFTNAIKICIEKGILKDYLQRKSREVINMLIAEYDYDTDIAVQREEAGKIAFAQGISQGSRQKALETAAAFKRFGFDIDKIAEATGLIKEEVGAIN